MGEKTDLTHKEKQNDSNLKREIGYKDIIKNKNYFKLIIAGAISRLGDSINFVAYSWIIYEITGSASIIALLAGVSSIPTFLFGTISGVIVTYFSKKRVMFICDIGRGVAVATLGLLYMTDNLLVWHLFVIAIIESIFEIFRGPARTAASSTMLTKEEYTYGISLSSTLLNIAQLIGLSIGGILIAVVGAGSSVLINAVSFFICGIIILTTRDKQDFIKEGTISIKGTWIDLKEGINYFKERKIVLYVTLISAGFMFCAIPINTMMAPYLDQVLGKGPELMSLIGIAQTVTLIIGGILMPKIASKFSRHNLFTIGGIIVGVSYLGFILISYANDKFIILGVIISISMLSIGLTGVNLIISVSLTEKTDKKFMARVSSIFTMIAFGIIPLGSFVVSGLCLFLNISQLFILFSLLMFIMFVGLRFNKILKEELQSSEK